MENGPKKNDGYCNGIDNCVNKAQILNDRYLLIREIGRGNFGSIWHAHDLEYPEHRNSVAIKIQSAHKNNALLARNEINFLKLIKKRDPLHKENVLRLFGDFCFDCDRGSHFATVTEILGSDLCGVIEDFRTQNSRKKLHRKTVVPIHYIRRFARDILRGLDFLHNKCGVVHTDLKPTNIMVGKQHSGFNKRVKLIDFGNAVFAGSTDNKHFGTSVYRAPESIMEKECGPKADIWALGCIVFEMATGDLLFKANWDESIVYNEDDDQLAQMIELIGPMPMDFIKNGGFPKKFFKPNGKLKIIAQIDEWKLEDVFREEFGFDQITVQKLTDFILPMLQLDPKDRISAAEALNHPFLR